MERPELATEVAERKGESVRRERDEKGRVREREREGGRELCFDSPEVAGAAGRPGIDALSIA